VIRHLNPEDKDQFISLIEAFFKERLEIDGEQFDIDNASKTFDLMIGMESVLALVAEQDGKIVGTIVGMIGDVLFGKGRMAQEMVWYVYPQNRGCGIRLIKSFESIAKDLGCDSLLMWGMQNDKSNDYYIRSGYKHIQNSYQKRISIWQSVQQ
jgi:predicted N-acetyltransferase YhbS